MKRGEDVMRESSGRRNIKQPPAWQRQKIYQYQLLTLYFYYKRLPSKAACFVSQMSKCKSFDKQQTEYKIHEIRHCFTPFVQETSYSGLLYAGVDLSTYCSPDPYLLFFSLAPHNILSATAPTCTTQYGSKSQSPIPTTTRTSTVIATLTKSSST